MSWWRQIFLRQSEQQDTVEIKATTQQSWNEPKRGDTAHGKTYLPGGPSEDPTPQYNGEIPPVGFSPRNPEPGMHCTISSGDLHRRGYIIAVTKKRITARVEYSRRTWTFTKRGDGTWMEEGIRKGGARLIAGVGLSNIKSKKLWYTPADIAGGWKIDRE